MRYLFLPLFLLCILISSAQTDSTLKVDLKLVNWSVGELEKVKAKGKKRRSVWQAQSSDGTFIKIVSKPIKKMTKVMAGSSTGRLDYQVKYFIIDGELSSYRLRAKSDVNTLIFGGLGRVLNIDLQKIDGGYIGNAILKTSLKEKVVVSSFVILYPDAKNIVMAGEKLLVLLPELSH